MVNWQYIAIGSQAGHSINTGYRNTIVGGQDWFGYYQWNG